MTLNCILVDDEPLAIKLLTNFVERTPFLHLVGSYLDPVEALSALTPEVHLLFLDIQMPGLTGLEFSRMVPPTTRIIFTTAYKEYAFESYQVQALHYLLKPISYPLFLEAATRAKNYFEQFQSNVQLAQPVAQSTAQLTQPTAQIVQPVTQSAVQTSVQSSAQTVAQASAQLSAQPVHNMASTPPSASEKPGNPERYDDPLTPSPGYIFVKCEFKMVRVDLDNILYISGLKDYVRITLKSQPRPLTALTTLKAIEEKLPPQRFLRVHRSYIVALDKIESLERNRLTISGELIPVAETYQEELMRRIN